MKMKLSTAKVIKQYGLFKEGKFTTIGVTVQIKVQGSILKKQWILETMDTLLEKVKYEEKQKIKDRFWSLSRGIPVLYKDTEHANIANDDFLKVIDWINFRTKTSMNMPCSICGSEEDVEMHHINHVRKRKLSSIPKEEIWTKVMGIRNRRQIPVCRNCHINLIHKGKYGGIKLDYFVPEIMYDNRIVNVESYINPAINLNSYKKSLTERGWYKE